MGRIGDELPLLRERRIQPGKQVVERGCEPPQFIPGIENRKTLIEIVRADTVRLLGHS